MRLGTLTLIGLVPLLVSIDLATARDGCGQGRYWNGYRCAPYAPHYGYGWRPYVSPPGPGDWGPQTTYRRDCYNYYGRRICCPKYWTVQDGVCKPYRGY